MFIVGRPARMVPAHCATIEWVLRTDLISFIDGADGQEIANENNSRRRGLCRAYDSPVCPVARSEGPASRIYLNQQRQFGVDNRDYMFAPRSNQDAMDKSLCSTAHDFCPGFHGDNG